MSRGRPRFVGGGGDSVSRSHMSYEPGGGDDDTCRSIYGKVNISRLIILKSLH